MLHYTSYQKKKEWPPNNNNALNVITVKLNVIAGYIHEETND